MTLHIWSERDAKRNREKDSRKNESHFSLILIESRTHLSPQDWYPHQHPTVFAANLMRFSAFKLAVDEVCPNSKGR